MAQSDGQEQHRGPVANMDQSGSHSQAAALFCYGLTPMQHSYMQWKQSARETAEQNEYPVEG